jgi:hypothetical protein
MFSSTFYKWLWRIVYVLALALIFLVVFISLTGCAHCKPEIVYQPVEVTVPVPVAMPPLPVPAAPECPPRIGGWRGSAAYLKGCYEALLVKIEEYNHIIRSYNESLVVPDP